MKTILISSAISLAIGFSFGWFIKSASSDIDRVAPETSKNVSPTPEFSHERDRTERPSSDHRPRRGTPNGTATIPEDANRADRAKWTHLIEALGLNDEQAKSLDAAMAESLPKPETGKSPEITYAEAGAFLEKKILALLDADQRKAFAAMKRLAMENQIEVSAQQTYSQDLGEFDLSQEQRGKALDLLRRRAEQIYAEIPSSTRLLLTGSFLPIDNLHFSEDAIRLLRQHSPQDSGDIILDKLTGKRRVEAEEKAKLYESFLTPAQLDLYRARLSASPNLHESILSGE